MFKSILKYIKIYAKLFRFGFIMETAYPVSFLIELVVETGYQIAFILFYVGIFQNVKSIAGWSYGETMFLVGMVMTVNEIFLGATYVFNLTRLPRKIKDGEIDTILLKPINSMFYLSLGLPYFCSFISALSGFFIMFYSVKTFNLSFNYLNLLPALAILVCGFTIAYSFFVMISSLSFKFINAVMLPEIAKEAIDVFAERPFSIYSGVLKIIFFWIFPVVYMVSVPTFILFHPLEVKYIVFSVGLAAFFIFLTKKIWARMIKLYSSASS